ncbi:HAMP domain-containing protein [Nostoc sp. B(2019)]|nr:HAMP domain-containing protein [Nostoc sp. B(2019)]
MNLRKKLFTIFGGLALLALASGGVTVWAIAKWHDSEDKLRNHYQRSLLLQQLRADTFRAFKEVPDAVTGDDPNSRQEFIEYLKPANEDFRRWAKLADTVAEKQQVQQIRNAYEILVKIANKAFDLVEAGRRKEAFMLMEGRLEDNDFRLFEDLTTQAVASDKQIRALITGQTQRTRQTAQLVLIISAFGILSLVFLLFAYLAADLFAPLRETEKALNDVARGDLQRRLDEERKDEFGTVASAFNRMTAAIAQREQVIGLTAFPALEADGRKEKDLHNMPSRLTLHTLVSQLRSRVSRLHNNQTDGNVAVAVEQEQELIGQMDQLLQAVARVTEFGFPLDLNLARTDIRALLYDVLLRFHDDFVRRGISFDLQIAPEVNYAVVDRLKLREALGELVSNALSALPELGGRIGIRSSLNTKTDTTELLIEVADDGTGSEQRLINRAFATFEDDRKQRPSVGLKLTKAIVEQHGGHLMIDSEPGLGTYVQIRLPWRVD